MIQLNNAHLHFGSTTALNGFDLSIQKGEQVALIGPSGSGKSSLLKVLATEHALTSGSLAIDSSPIASLSSKSLQQLRCKVGYIPQDLALVPNLKVSQNILLGRVGQQSLGSTLKNLLIPAKLRLAEVLQLLEEVGIPEKLFHRTDSLSGGQQQRVAIARAIYQEAAILLADEPVSAVDPSRAHSLLDCLTDLSRRHELTLICSMHNLEYAKKFFPRLIGMRDGKIIFDGATESFSDKDFSELYTLINA
jgi:phosphonate transport system ATP-binding protein